MECEECGCAYRTEGELSLHRTLCEDEGEDENRDEEANNTSSTNKSAKERLKKTCPLCFQVVCTSNFAAHMKVINYTA
jgi:hypothetical protein